MHGGKDFVQILITLRMRGDLYFHHMKMQKEILS